MTAFERRGGKQNKKPILINTKIFIRLSSFRQYYICIIYIYIYIYDNCIADGGKKIDLTRSEHENNIRRRTPRSRARERSLLRTRRNDMVIIWRWPCNNVLLRRRMRYRAVVLYIILSPHLTPRL